MNLVPDTPSQPKAKILPLLSSCHWLTRPEEKSRSHSWHPLPPHLRWSSTANQSRLTLCPKWLSNSRTSLPEHYQHPSSRHLGLFSQFIWLRGMWNIHCIMQDLSLRYTDFTHRVCLTGSRVHRSVVWARVLGWPEACGIFDPWSNLHPFHCKADSQPLDHAGSPSTTVYRLPQWSPTWSP